jgi:hypothetical protein
MAAPARLAGAPNSASGACNHWFLVLARERVEVNMAITCAPLPLQGPGTLAQYAEISLHPKELFFYMLLCRIVFITFEVLVWVVGWRHVRLAPILVAPPILHAVLLLAETIHIHRVGPLVHFNSWAGKVALAIHIMAFSYITSFPLVLLEAQKPFGSTLAHLASAGVCILCAGTFCSAYITLEGSKERIDVRYHIVWQGLIRLMRFEDCWTDMSVASLLLREV